MHVFLALLLYFGILTLWVPEYWPISVFQVGIFALAGIALWRARSFSVGPAYPLAPLTFAAIWGLFQSLTGRTVYAFNTQMATVQWATYLAVFLSAFYLLETSSLRRWFRSAMVWFAFLVAVVATLQNFTSGGKVFWLFPSGYTDFVMGPIVSRNHYAAFIEAVLPMALNQAIRGEGDSLLYSGMASAMYASVIASASRAGTVLATLEILAVFACMRIRGRASSRDIGRAFLTLAAIVAVLVVVVGYEAIWNRFLAPDPMSGRREFAVSTVHMIADHPWSGVGLGNWPVIYPRYATVDLGAFVNAAHNDWLQWTAEGGFPLGIAMLSLFIWCIRPAFASVWGLGVIAVFLHALVDYPFSRPALGSWTMVIIALLALRSGEARPSSVRLDRSRVMK